MKVYLVCMDTYEYPEYFGMYDNLEAAQQHCNDLITKARQRWIDLYRDNQQFKPADYDAILNGDWNYNIVEFDVLSEYSTWE